MSWNEQRDAMYKAWAAKKNWTRVELVEFEGQWKAYCPNALYGFIVRPTRRAALAAIQYRLSEMNTEISNLAELLGIAPEKKTFVEWLREVEFKRQYFEHHEPVPQHKLIDANFWEKHVEDIKIKMPEGKIEYKS